tara:strand:+ start:3746 stop:4141 length:396 start_codon:yes stop_codon:yes gene_type:complete
MIYLFYNTETDEYREVQMSMKEYTPYRGENGTEDSWERVYETPQISMRNSTASKMDPYDQNQFVDRTGKMKGSVGDMLDYSKELSDKRAEKNGGVDPVKQKYFRNYEKKTGKKHLRDKKSYESKNVKIDYD